ncbi:DUF305 domain-containing protein [Rothia sp. ARF10]|nr:DUF305 domain-containing protein [Rothia sp. ARF10]
MDHGSSSSSTTSGTTDAGRSGDVMFAQMMIPRHEQAVEMADLALERPSSAEVTGLARKIKAAQGPEIATMQEWLREWRAPAAADGSEHMGHGGGMMSDADMGRLGAAQGAAFDRMWLTMMIEHHEGAVVMAKDVLGTTTNPDVKAMAQAIVDGQTEEIGTMRALL